MRGGVGRVGNLEHCIQEIWNYMSKKPGTGYSGSLEQGIQETGERGIQETWNMVSRKPGTRYPGYREQGIQEIWNRVFR